MSEEGKSLRPLSKKVNQEDFTTINPMAIWEAEKRLFFLPVVTLADQVEAVNYLRSNRLDYSYQYIRERCLQFEVENDYTHSSRIPLNYINPWFAPWVEEVNIFWNRIEYIISNPCKKKHESFRMSCTSMKAFNSAQRFTHDSSEPFPVENLNPIEDIPCLSHEYDENSPFGVVILSDDVDNYKKISYGKSPMWVWDDEPIVLVWSAKEDFDIYLNQKARDENTKKQIDFLNGFRVSDKVLDFIKMYCISGDSKIISLEEDPYIITDEGKRSAETLQGRVHIIKSVCEAIEMFDIDYQDILVRTLCRSKWFKNIFDMESEDV